MPDSPETYGDWTVIGKPTRDKWLCRCKCGRESMVGKCQLKIGRSKKCVSCRAKGPKRWLQKYPHPANSTPKIRQKANNAIRRCTDESCAKFKHYGGRGIKVHERWLAHPEEFVEYLMTLDGWNDDSLRLDRIDNNRGYEPGNLRFTTISESMRNRRRWGTSKTTMYRRRKEGLCESSS